METTGTTLPGGDTLMQQGAALLKQGKFSEAIPLLREAVTQAPGDEGGWRLLGGALASSGSHAEAIDAFRSAVALAPTSARNHYNLGVALQGAGNTAEARASYEKALALDSLYEQARARLNSLPSAAQATAPAAPPAMGLGGIGGGGMAGLGSIGVGSASSAGAAPPPADAPGSGGLSGIGGMQGLGSVGGGGLSGIGGGAGLGSIGGGSAGPTEPPPSPVGGLSGVGGGPTLRAPTPPPSAAPGGVYTPGQIAGGLGANAPTPILGLAYGGMHVNSSGMQGEVPPEVAGGFNLGAAVIPFWWLRNHNMRHISIGLAIIYILLRFSASVSHSLSLILLGGIQIGVFFVLGFMGNRLAWQNRRFDDVEDCRACQRIWSYWAIPRLALQIGFFLSDFFISKQVASLGIHH